MPTMGRERVRHPSLRRHLLGFVLIPLAVLLVLEAFVTYNVALRYANRVHDQDLSDDALTLARMLSNPRFGNALTSQARFLLEYDPGDRNYFAVTSRRHGLLAGSAALAARVPVHTGAAPTLYSTDLGNSALRAATIDAPASNDARDTLSITVAETLRDRRRQAREILLLATATQAVLIASVFLLVWLGVRRGLRVLDPLTARLAASGHDLTPLGEDDVPREILPLTRTIDALFARLREMLALHDRFIADAAHQLRTPLAGLSLQAERALAAPGAAEVHDALRHIQRLTHRATRTSTQLLALTRAQMGSGEASHSRRIDLARLIPDAVAARVPDAIAAGVDLGYAGAVRTLGVVGDTASVLNLLDNLIDNAIRYGGRGSTITVDLQQRGDGGANLAVEDDGPGIDPRWLPRIGERFFRVPDSPGEGSGLGLAIVLRIAERHGASLVYSRSRPHGLRVEVRFPPAPSPAA